MRLELGRRADYGIRATIDLARHHPTGERRKARRIAEEMEIPPSFVAQVLADLVRAGIVTSTAGPAGGYELARAPKEITLLDVVEAVSGEPEPATCVLRGGPCRWDDFCAVHVPWARAQKAMLGELGGATFAEVIDIDVALDAGTYQLPADLTPPPARRRA